MTPKELDQIVAGAKAYLRYLGSANKEGAVNANDFAQYCAEYCIKRPELSPIGFLYRYRFIDYMREKCGRSTPGLPHPRKLAILQYEQLEHHCLAESQKGTAQKNLDVMSAEKYLSCLSKYERLAYCLHHVYEFSQVEISRIMGVHYSRISQELNDSQLKIKRRISALNSKIRKPADAADGK